MAVLSDIVLQAIEEIKSTMCCLKDFEDQVIAIIPINMPIYMIVISFNINIYCLYVFYVFFFKKIHLHQLQYVANVTAFFKERPALIPPWLKWNYSILQITL